MISGNNLVKGILIGVGVSAVGFYLYKKNEDKVDSFLRNRGMDIKPRSSNYETMSVEELMRTKETIEDLIAEKEMQEQSITVEASELGTAEA
jgi:hypothetical protein